MNEPTTDEKLKVLREECLQYRAALMRHRQGMFNILELRKIAGTERYGALTREEIEGVISDIDALLIPEASEAGLPAFPVDRCRVCGWPLTDSRGGCRKDDCSMRPKPFPRADEGYAPEGEKRPL
jgi:hypothetical protein